MPNISSNQLQKDFGLTRQALYQAKKAHPTWFVEIGRDGKQVIYDTAGIEKFARYMRLLAEVKAAGCVK